MVEKSILNSANFHRIRWDQKEMHLRWYTQDDGDREVTPGLFHMVLYHISHGSIWDQPLD